MSVVGDGELSFEDGVDVGWVIDGSDGAGGEVHGVQDGLTGSEGQADQGGSVGRDAGEAEPGHDVCWCIDRVVLVAVIVADDPVAVKVGLADDTDEHVAVGGDEGALADQAARAGGGIHESHALARGDNDLAVVDR
ncbi:MAG: hypothetical protein R2749_01415 [Acidimicrobiales bacterium]